VEEVTTSSYKVTFETPEISSNNTNYYHSENPIKLYKILSYKQVPCEQKSGFPEVCHKKFYCTCVSPRSPVWKI